MLGLNEFKMTTIYIVTANWRNNFTDTAWLVKAFRTNDAALQFIKENKTYHIDYDIEEVLYE